MELAKRVPKWDELSKRERDEVLRLAEEDGRQVRRLTRVDKAFLMHQYWPRVRVVVKKGGA